MPKANKSSASAGTRKKNQAKKAAREGTEFDDSAPPPPAGGKMQRGQKKLSKAQKKALPKVKQYIPPPKPPALLIPDPLDGQGLARTLPAELVVVLRRLGKKDDVTRRKGLDELREGWVVELQRPPSKAAVEGDTEAEGEEGSEELERELKETALLEAVPVWLHNLASLLQSPFHRTVAIQLHAELLAIPSIRTAILDTLELFLLPGTQNRDVLGSWLVAALEEGRRGGGAGLKSWETSFYVGEPSEEKDGEGRINLTTKIPTLIEYLSLSILDPASLHDDIHPAPVATSAPAPAPVKKGGKGKASLPPPPQATSASTEDVEAEEERTARYRIGGLTGLAWLLKQPKPTDQAILDQLLKLVLEPSLWSSLSSVAPNSDDSPPFGYRQPYVRRAAYAVLEPLLATYPEVIAREDMLSLLADNLLGCCWLESEALVWETAGTPIITLLSRHKELWDIAKDANNGDVRDQDAQDRDDDEDQDDSEDEDDDEDEVGENTGEPAAADIPAPTRSYKVFDDLLQFISTTCPAVPHKTYPLLVVIISTLPQTLLPLSDGPSPQLQTLFSHLWSPVDARLLSTHALPGQPSAFQAFLRDSVDCTSYLIGKCSKIEGGEATAKWLVGEQLGHRVWKQGVLEFGGRSAGRRTVQARPETEASTFGQLLAKLGKTSIELQSDLLDSVKTTTLAQTDPADEKTALALLPRILPVLQAVEDVNEQEEVKTAIDQIRAEVAGQCAAALEAESLGPITKAYLEVLVSTIKDHPEVVTSETQSRLVSTVQNPSRLMQAVSPDLYVSLVNSLGTAYSAHETTVSSATSTLLSSQTEQATRLALAKSLLQSKSALLTPASLDDLAEEAVQSALTDHNESAAQVTALCVNAEGALSHDALHTVLALVATSIHDSTHSLVTTQPDVRIPQEAIEIFASYAQQHAGEVIDSEILQGALVGVHHLAVLLPRLHEEGYVVPPAAQELWSRSKELRDEDEEKLAKLVLADLASLISDVSCRVEPGILVDVAMVAIPGTTATDISQRILPDISHIQDLVSEFTSRQPNPTLSIVDSVIPCPPVDDDASRDPGSFDVHGRSRGARLAEAALALIRSDRQFASSSATLLQTVLSARALAQDALAVPGASRGFFDKSTPVEYLAQVVREAEGTLSFSLASLDDVALDWHKTTSDLIKKGQAASGGLDFLQSLLVMLSERISSAADDVSARTLRDVLGRFLSQSGAGEKEAEVWLNLGMGKIDSNPTLALAVISAVKPFLLDTKPLEVAQNRLANNLAGIPAKSANAKGLPALRLLIASAPPRDAASVFIPQQRALFVLRHIASWLTSDEDLEEEFDLRVAELYAVMAPIVQDVQGAHWDSIFDLIETGLESGSLQDEHSLSFLYQCLSLLQQVRDLCETNKSLRALWTNKDVHMKLVLQLFLQCTNANSVPLQTVQDLILDLLASAPTTIIGDSGLPELSRLLGESNSYSVQCTAYKILKQVVEKRTLALILDVEASVAEAEEGHQSKIIHLPGELVEIVEKGRGITWHEEPEVELVLGQLLAWMSILDHFEDASRTLRWAYLDQLNTDGLLDQILLPMLFAMLGVSEVGAWNFASSSYAVDEFYTDLLQPEDLADLTPLASHLFYRALVTIPSALRTYYESLKDRQLSMSMLNFTARHYSPVIIQNEFAALRQPAAMAQLTEEGLNVKIAQGGGATVAAGSAGSSEAIASYVVDEQPMEIGIRLPAEFPLRGVEIRDLRRVGVPENKWRGWLMSVQQTITSRNGLILEALTVFKKNVSLHFEGVVECAICYSIISLTDRTLPTKPCRTCKNRFHASCLYKWFNSSHSSSCPLCRALF